MKQYLLFGILLIPGIMVAQHGIVKESLSMSSKILGKEVQYSNLSRQGMMNRAVDIQCYSCCIGYTDDETAGTSLVK
jgi:hypothetical protein